MLNLRMCLNYDFVVTIGWNPKNRGILMKSDFRYFLEKPVKYRKPVKWFLFVHKKYGTWLLFRIKLNYENFSFASQYSKPVQVNYFTFIRKAVKEYIGFDAFYVIFNLFRLVLASVLKDYIISWLPFSMESKSMGQKLIFSMKKQLEGNFIFRILVKIKQSGKSEFFFSK